MDRTNIVTPTVTAVPRNEHWMKIFFVCKFTRLLSDRPISVKTFVSLLPGSFQPGSRHQKRSQGWKLWPPFLSKVVYNCKDFCCCCIIRRWTSLLLNWPCPKLWTYSYWPVSYLCPVEHWTDIYCERDVLKTYPHSLVEPSCHNPFENYWELPICWPETWKYENDKQINLNSWTECRKFKKEECVCFCLHLPHCWATPLPKVIAENGKELEACWPSCLGLFAPFTACAYSYLWYSQGKYLTLNQPLIRSSSTNMFAIN